MEDNVCYSLSSKLFYLINGDGNLIGKDGKLKRGTLILNNFKIFLKLALNCRYTLPFKLFYSLNFFYSYCKI